jgi:hypothetical protein
MSFGWTSIQFPRDCVNYLPLLQEIKVTDCKIKKKGVWEEGCLNEVFEEWMSGNRNRIDSRESFQKVAALDEHF